MTPKTLNQPKGRPALTEYEQGVLVGSLKDLTPRTAEFRKKRRELAVLLERTERNIDQYYESLVATKQKAPGTYDAQGLVSDQARVPE